MTLTSCSRSQEVKTNNGKYLVCTLSSEGMNGFKPNRHNHIIDRCKRTDKVLVTFTPFLNHMRPKNVEKALSVLSF